MERIRKIYFVSKEEVYEALDGRLHMDICEIILKYKRIAELPTATILLVSTVTIAIAMEMN